MKQIDLTRHVKSQLAQRAVAVLVLFLAALAILALVASWHSAPHASWVPAPMPTPTPWDEP